MSSDFSEKDLPPGQTRAVGRAGEDTEVIRPGMLVNVPGQGSAVGPSGKHASEQPQPRQGINYQIRTEHLVKTRREPPELGWRKAVYAATFNTVNPGRSGFERRLDEQKALIASNFPGNYQIPVISIKGGVGKTRTVAGVGTV